jgi:hypothetical protein
MSTRSYTKHIPDFRLVTHLDVSKSDTREIVKIIASMKL